MKASIQSIRTLSADRANKVKPLILELTTVIRDDSKPADYRQRRERELRAEISRTNEEYNRRIGQAALEAVEEPRQRYAAGSPHTQEHLTQAQLIVAKYQGRPARQQRQQLVDEIAADLRAGNVTGARVKALAADTLDIPLGPLAAQLNHADPIKRDAQDTLDTIEGLNELALHEPLREQAAAGLLGTRERLFLKVFADQRGLRPDVPFPDQVEPGYSGPDVKTAGTPLNPFPEPHDPKRDEQRAVVDRIGRDTTTPADTAARYAARGGKPVEPGGEPAEPGDDSD